MQILLHFMQQNILGLYAQVHIDKLSKFFLVILCEYQQIRFVYVYA